MAGLPDIVLRDGRVLPGSLLEFKASRSSGPGGQNVNKVASKVDLRLNLGGAQGVLTSQEVERVRQRLGGRMDAEGRIRVVVAEHRTQAANLRQALARMGSLIDQALVRRQTRVRTNPPASYHRKRIERKRRHGQLKRQRGARFDRDE